MTDVFVHLLEIVVHIFYFFLIMIATSDVSEVFSHSAFISENLHFLIHEFFMFTLIMLKVISQVVHGFKMIAVNGIRSHGWRHLSLVWSLEEFLLTALWHFVVAICDIEVILTYLLMEYISREQRLFVFMNYFATSKTLVIHIDISRFWDIFSG